MVCLDEGEAMSWLLVPLLLVGSADDTLLVLPPDRLVAQIEAESVTGTLLVSEGDCLAVKTFTGSPYTHVGTIVHRDGRCFVYDSTAGHGVRCQTLSNYVKWLDQHEVRLLHPSKPFSSGTEQAFVRHLESELGRPYAVLHHLTGERCDGVHCAEYVTEALVAANRMTVAKAPRVSPASLVAGVTQSGVYQEGGRFQRELPIAVRPEPTSWCAGCWRDTKDCMKWCWKKTRGAILCQ